ncbi:MAG: hypothetical protein J6331_06905, partial [Lentisphaeria bacterium]|nr:hypothetical protein [Lentisphaeria bacterium]
LTPWEYAHSSLCSLLYRYKYRDRSFATNHKSERRDLLPTGTAGSREFSLFASLYREKYTDFYKETPEVKTFRKMNEIIIRNRFQSSIPFLKFKPELETLLKKLTPGKGFPSYVTNWESASRYLNDLAGERVFPTCRQSEGAFLPFYLYDVTPEKGLKEWTFPILLTHYERTPYEERFISLPLFTWHDKTEREELFTTLGYLGYYGKKRKIDRISRPIFSRETFQVKSFHHSELENEYAACGLYYHGRDGFYVAKEGFDGAFLESLRKRAYALREQEERLFRERKKIDERKARHAKWVTKTKIDEYKKLIDEEEIRILEKSYSSEDGKYSSLLKKFLADGKKLGAKFSPEDFKDEKKFQTMLEKFFDDFTVIRYSEDYGSGLFYRKELFSNGDFRWHTFFYLAGGEKKGEQEKTQVLHFFYRFNKEGAKEEKLIFPFISLQKDENFERTSFLWRVYEKTVKNGKTSGHIFFIPFGEAGEKE